MGFKFNLFTTSSHHRVFNYKPLYYDPEKERFKEKLRKVTAERELKEAQEAKDNTPSPDYVPGSYIQGSLRDGAYRRVKTEGGMAVKVMRYVSIVAIAGFLYYFAKYFLFMVD